MKNLLLLSLLLLTAVTARADTKVILPDSQRYADAGKDFLVETRVPGDFQSLDGIVFALLTLSPLNPKQLYTPFFPGKVSRATEPLSSTFRGVRKKGKKVTLRFTGDAMPYLDSAISMQEQIKGSLEGTIKLHARDCKEIEYEVDGSVVTEWDA
jgi:hypothetical protein